MYNADLDGCNSSITSQYQDYTVTVEPNNSKPDANFSTTDLTVKSGTFVQFNDLSTSFPTSWHWTFEGATPLSSNSQNPVVTYNTAGSYDVQLVAENEFGSDTLVITDYITVTNTYVMGLDKSSTAESGIILDSGGEDGNYKTRENYSFLIAPICSDSITLSFKSFSTDSCCDYLNVYDGENIDAPLLLTASGSVIPANVTALSGKMYITFYSDVSTTYPGFKGSWTGNHTQKGSLPAANFYSSYDSIPFSWCTQLIDSSLNDPYKWTWTFDNQELSFDQNAVHKFSESGTSSVKLKVENCAGEDSIFKDLNIQLPPELMITEDTIHMHLFTDQKDISYIPFNNSKGHGDLMYTASLNLDEQVSNLDSTKFLRGRNVLINTYYDKYFSSDLITNGASVYNLNSYWERTLDTIDILILDHNTSLSTYMTDSVINWLKCGGTLIVSDYNFDTQYDRILNSVGINYNNDYCNSGYATYIFPGILTRNISQYVVNNSNTGLSIKDNNAFSVISGRDGFLSVAASSTQTSKILAMTGCPFYSSYYYDTGHQQLIRNFLLWSSGRKWVTVEPDEGSLVVNASDSLLLKFDASYLYGGDYITQLLVQSNDTSGTEIRIPIKLTVTGVPKIQLDKNHIDYGKIFYGHSNQIMQQLNISNTGTDNLIIDTIYTSDAVFYSNTTEINISPEHECTLSIFITPDSVKEYNDTLFIHSNDTVHPLTAVYLHANSVMPPVINVTPDSVNFEIYSNEKDSATIQVDNVSGGSELDIYNLIVETINPDSSNVFTFENSQILISSTKYLYGIESELINRGANVLHYTGTITKAVLDTIDVLVIDGGYYKTAEETQVIRSWVQKGGSVVLDISDFNSYLSNLLSETGIQYLYGSSSNGNTYNFADHDISRNLDYYYINHCYYSLSVTAPAKPVILNTDSSIYCSASYPGEW